MTVAVPQAVRADNRLPAGIRARSVLPGHPGHHGHNEATPTRMAGAKDPVNRGNGRNRQTRAKRADACAKLRPVALPTDSDVSTMDLGFGFVAGSSLTDPMSRLLPSRRGSPSPTGRPSRHALPGAP